MSSPIMESSHQASSLRGSAPSPEPGGRPVACHAPVPSARHSPLEDARHVPVPPGRAMARLTPDRPAARDLGQLRHLLRFLQPYRRHMLGALAALVVAAGTVLALGSGLRLLVDQGFAQADVALLDRAVLVLFAVTIVLA